VADVRPNYLVEQQRIKSQVAAQWATVERQRLEILELVDRKRRNEENIDAALRAIDELKESLAALADAHGALDDAAYQRLAGEVGEVSEV
jgi:hypothetical protein